MDSSVLIEADEASGQPLQTEDNIGMDPVYYNAAAEGNIGVFRTGFPKPLNQLLTPNSNTVLHIHLTSLTKRSEDSESKILKSKDSKPEDLESSTAFVKEILSPRMCPSLLWQANVKGEIPLHIAARYGHDTTVGVLIEHAKALQEERDLENGVNIAVKKMLEKTNNEKDTALHEAVRGNHLEVVKRLIKEGPDFSYSQNDAGETPLYIAVERNFQDVAFHILEACTSPSHDGSLGRKTLHAAAIWNNKVMIEKIMEYVPEERQSAFIKQADKEGLTPLHCAAYFYYSSPITKKLLKVDRYIAYMKDANSMTALHIAAHQGHVEIMKELLEYCPDCFELVDQRGWNALHISVNSSSPSANDVVNVILNTPSLSNLLNEKDAEGETPLHHHSKSLNYIKDLVCHNRVDKMAFDKQNLDAYDIALTTKELSDKKFMEIRRVFKDNRPAGFRRLLGDDVRSKRKSDFDLQRAKWDARKARFVSIMKTASKTHLVVDTLIATVAFRAGITMPGGFIGDEGPHPGSAVLIRNTAFKAFVITNTIAMVQSCSAAFIHLFMPLLFQEQNPGPLTFLLVSLAFCLYISAMGAMMLAFVTATYGLLMHSLNLAIVNCVIGLCFFIPVFFVSIGCARHLREMWNMGLALIIQIVLLFFDGLGFLGSLMCLCICIRLPYRYFRIRFKKRWWGIRKKFIFN